MHIHELLIYIQRLNIENRFLFVQSKPQPPQKKKLDLLLTCLSVSDPNKARLLSFQSYCFCLIILNEIVLTSLVYRP